MDLQVAACYRHLDRIQKTESGERQLSPENAAQTPYPRGPSAPLFGLLRSAEEPDVRGLAEHVALKRFHHRGSRFERVGRAHHIELRIERDDLEDIVMQRTGSWCAGTAIDRAACADLMAAIGKRLTLRHSLRKSSCRAWDVPHDPMRLIVEGFVTRDVDVVHARHQSDRSRR